jgi:uncharacterized membrane protein YwzB
MGYYTFEFSCRNNYDKLCFSVLIHYILVGLVYWCIDSLNMAEFRKNM